MAKRRKGYHSRVTRTVDLGNGYKMHESMDSDVYFLGGCINWCFKMMWYLFLSVCTFGIWPLYKIIRWWKRHR